MAELIDENKIKYHVAHVQMCVEEDLSAMIKKKGFIL